MLMAGLGFVANLRYSRTAFASAAFCCNANVNRLFCHASSNEFFDIVKTGAIKAPRFILGLTQWHGPFEQGT
jgi:hypothetical protein